MTENEDFAEIERRVSQLRYDSDIQSGRIIAFVAEWYRRRLRAQGVDLTKAGSE